MERYGYATAVDDLAQGLHYYDGETQFFDDLLSEAISIDGIMHLPVALIFLERHHDQH